MFGRLIWKTENIKGRWTGEFLPAASGCTVTLTEDVTPKKAWMRPLAGMFLRRQQLRYLSDRREALGLQGSA